MNHMDTGYLPDSIQYLSYWNNTGVILTSNPIIIDLCKRPVTQTDGLSVYNPRHHQLHTSNQISLSVIPFILIYYFHFPIFTL